MNKDKKKRHKECRHLPWLGLTTVLGSGMVAYSSSSWYKWRQHCGVDSFISSMIVFSLTAGLDVSAISSTTESLRLNECGTAESDRHSESGGVESGGVRGSESKLPMPGGCGVLTSGGKISLRSVTTQAPIDSSLKAGMT